MSLLTKLGLKAPKVIAGATLETVGAPETGGKSGPVDESGPDMAMLDNATTYAQALAAAQKEVASLGSDPSLADAKAKIQTDLIDTARGLAKAGGYKGAASLLGQVAGRVAAAIAKANGDYDKARAAVRKRIDALEGHALKAKVMAKINAAKTKMTAAQGRADKNEFDAAAKLVAEAEPICVQAQTEADKHAAYAVKRADAMALIASFKGVLKDTTITAMTTKVTQADAKVAAAPPDFAAADTLIESVRTELGDQVKSWYVTPTRAEIAALKLKPTASYVADDLKRIDAIQAEVEAAVAARAWTKAILSGKRVDRILSPAGKLVDRRAVYEAQRSKTDAALAPLKGRPAAKDILAALMQRYQAAEALASRVQVHPEQGAAELARIEAECASALQAAALAEAYAKDRPGADAQLAALEKHAAVDRIAEPLRAVRQQLTGAATAAAAAAKGAMLTNWQAAQAAVTRALADLATAKALADNLGPAANAQAAAVGAKDGAALTKAIQALRTAADAARKQPFADRAATPYKNLDDGLKAADAAVAAKDLAKAAASLAEAGDAFAAARTIQAEHGQFVDLEKSVDARLKALEALTAPDPKTIAARIDALRKGLADARAKDNAHAGADAMAALRGAEDAAGAAELAARERSAFDALAVETAKAVKALTDKKFQADLDKLMKDATSQADAFKFDAAKAALKGVEVRIAGEKVKALAKSNPNDPAFATAAKEMMDKGGEKYLDSLIATLPDNANMKALTTLATVRFGAEFVAGSDSEVPAMRRICVMMAKVPKDVARNPSLKLVRHETPGKNSGAYGTSGGVVTMNGRPKQSYQQFGANQKNSEGKDQLGAVEPECQPVNTDAVDYMDFATLHEVGHSVDDANMFMASREGVAEFGGWRRHGGNLEPIADAVSQHFKYDRAYVLQKLQRLPAVAPAAKTGVSAKDWSDRQKLVDDWYKIATAKKVWWSQSGCDTITIGTEKIIFQEAYEQDWVSYLAAARKKGMTGYQFRAPGEWFAELYAAFHSGKLKKTHPSAKWLSKLSV